MRWHKCGESAADQGTLPFLWRRIKKSGSPFFGSAFFGKHSPLENGSRSDVPREEDQSGGVAARRRHEFAGIDLQHKFWAADWIGIKYEARERSPWVRRAAAKEV